MALSSIGQKKYSAKATSTEITLEGKTLVGYKTSFDFQWNEVRKGWWKYAKDFGAPLNMKTYYKVTIPSETTDGNVNLEVFTQTTEGKKKTDFFLGLENNKYEEQALLLLQDFKKKFYIEDLLAKIEKEQQQSEKLSDQYRNRSSKKQKQEALQKITKIERSIEALKEEIRRIERS